MEYPFCQLLNYHRLLDEGRDDLAVESLERALATSARGGKALRQALFLEAVCGYSKECRTRSQLVRAGLQASETRIARFRGCDLLRCVKDAT